MEELQKELAKTKPSVRAYAKAKLSLAKLATEKDVDAQLEAINDALLFIYEGSPRPEGSEGVPLLDYFLEKYGLEPLLNALGTMGEIYTPTEDKKK